MPKTKYFFHSLLLLLFLSFAGCKADTSYPPPIPGVTRTNNWLEGMHLFFPRPPSETAFLLLEAAGFTRPGHDPSHFSITKYDPYNRAHLNALEQAFREGATAKGY